MTVADHGRLRRGSDISAVLRSRRQSAGRFVVVHAATRSDGGDRARVAVIASRRVGGAVQRNRAKRLLREAVRPLPLRADTDLVLIARPRCASARFRAVRSEVEALTRRLDVVGADTILGVEG